MKKISEYRQHAEECRSLAQRMRHGNERDQLLAMANTWDGLADERAVLIRRYPELAIDDEESRNSHPASESPDRLLRP